MGNRKKMIAYNKDKQKYENDDKKIALARKKMENTIEKASDKADRIAMNNIIFAEKHQLKAENAKKAQVKKEEKEMVKNDKHRENVLNHFKNILRHCRNKIDSEEDFSLESFSVFPDC